MPDVVPIPGRGDSAGTIARLRATAERLRNAAIAGGVKGGDPVAAVVDALGEALEVEAAVLEELRRQGDRLGAEVRRAVDQDVVAEVITSIESAVTESLRSRTWQFDLRAGVKVALALVAAVSVGYVLDRADSHLLLTSSVCRQGDVQQDPATGRHYCTLSVWLDK